MTDGKPNQIDSRTQESRIMETLHVVGINVGVVAMLGAAVFTFFLALLKLFAAIWLFFIITFGPVTDTLRFFGIVRKPVILMLVDIVDTSLLATILLTLAFGLKSVFLGKRYKVVAFDVTDINQLKEYLIGLVITLMGTRFLERVLRGGLEPNIQGFGFGIAAVILALAIYEWVLMKHKELESADK
jgi:uncharacterized membrane protein YqhA